MEKVRGSSPLGSIFCWYLSGHSLSVPLFRVEKKIMEYKTELDKLLTLDTRNKILTDYVELKTKLGGSGASKKAAELMMEYLRKL